MNPIDRGEELFTIGELVRKLKVCRSINTLQRWCTTGLARRGDGKVIVMDSVFIGAWRHSSAEAVQRFLSELQGKD